MREKILSVLALMSISQAFAQDNLINALANNQGKDVQKYYQIKPVFAVGVTDVKVGVVLAGAMLGLLSWNQK